MLNFKDLIKILLSRSGLRNPFNKIFSGNLEKINIIEIVDFFEQNNIKINICDNTKKTIDNIKLNHKNFGEKIRLLSEIKNNFNTDDFNLFSLLVDNLKRKLKEHQKKSAYHLYKAECAANFSVPGSGKTSVVLAVYEILKNIDSEFTTLPYFDMSELVFYYQELAEKYSLNVSDYII